MAMYKYTCLLFFDPQDLTKQNWRAQLRTQVLTDRAHKSKEDRMSCPVLQESSGAHGGSSCFPMDSCACDDGARAQPAYRPVFVALTMRRLCKPDQGHQLQYRAY